MPTTTASLRPSYDAVVVGARCAGASTAMLLARAGQRVLLLDRGRCGKDTLSTHGLMMGGVVQLHRWGLLPKIEAAGTPRIGTATFVYARDPVQLQIKPRFGVEGLCAPRRTVLDAVLVSAAVDAGAHVLFGARVDGLVRAGERVSGVRFKGPDGTFHEVGAELVIGADGRSSSVAQLVGASPYRTSRHFTACVYTYVTDVEDQGYRWYYGRRAHAGLIPTNDGAHCAFVLVPPQTLQPLGRRSDPDTRFAELAALADADLPHLLSSARRLEPYRTFTGLPGFLRPAAGPGWALVGDAGYFKDPCTAHGMTDALRDAELLTRAALDGSAEAMAAYQHTRDELSLPLFEMTDEIASFPRDLDRLREIHIELSRHMQHEARYVAELDARGLAA